MTGPTLTGFAPVITFDEALANAGPQLLDADVVLTAGTHGLGGATLTISGLLAEDRISVLDSGTGIGQVGLSGSSVTYSGISIGTISGGIGSTFTIEFGAFAGAVSIDAVIQSLTYANVSNTPTLNRTFVLDITDTEGGRLNGHPPSFTEVFGAANPFDSFVVQWESSPTLLDIDSDGDLDLVVGERFGTLRVLQNNGNGTFTNLFNTPHVFTNLDFGTNSTPAFGDVNNDGLLDLVIGGLYETVRVYANNGAGGYVEQFGAANPFSALPIDSAPSFGDIDGDGDLDMVAGGVDGLLRTFLNNGNGTFSELTGVANPFNGVDVGINSSPSFVDLDGDGFMDAVIGAGDGTLHSLLNDGSGVFTQLIGAANPFNAVDVGSLAAPSFIDVNGDLALDAVVGAYDGRLRTFLATPNFSFDVNVPLDSNAPRLTGLSPSVAYSENLVNATPQLLDPVVEFSDDDGNLDGGALTVSGLLAEDRVSILNQGTGAGEIGLSGANVTFGGTVIGTLAGGVGTSLIVSFAPAVTQTAVDALIQNLTYANVSDTPTAQRTLALDVTDGHGQHLNAVPPTYAALTGGDNPFNGVDVIFYSAPSFVDLDGDGDMDAVIGGNNGTLTSFANDGAGNFSLLSGLANPFDGLSFGFHTTVDFGDLDGDGDLDAVVGDGLGLLRTLANDGTGVFTQLPGAANPFDGVDVGFSSTPAFLDLDDDGDLDLVVGERTGTLLAFANNGSGVFTALAGAANPFLGMNFGSFARPVFVDLDADGDMDLVSGQENGALRYFENGGAGVFHEQFQVNNPFDGMNIGGRSAPGFVDLDGDGDLDAVVGQTDGTLLAFENTSPLQGGPLVSITVTVTNDLDTFTGTSADDNLVGTLDGDLLDGLAGNDTLRGRAGNDTVNGGSGNDVLNGGGGADMLNGGSGTDRAQYNLATAGVRADLLDAATNTGEAAGDIYVSIENLLGSDFGDVLIGDGGANRLFGIGGSDVLLGGDGGDELVGGDGNDVLNGGTGADTIRGGNDDDIIVGGDGLDWLYGDTGADTLFGSAGNDRMFGQGGNDVLSGGVGNDMLDGGTGIDTADYGSASDNLTVNLNTAGFQFVSASQGSDRLTNVEAVSGGSGNDVLFGDGGDNTLRGGLGQDRLSGGGGNDLLEGGAGTGVDFLNYYFAAGGVTVDLGNQGIAQAIGGGQGTDTFTGIEGILGSGAGADNLLGDGSANTLRGYGGEDTLDGDAGDDYIAGGAGNDSLRGENGGDTILGEDGNDLIGGGDGNDALFGGSGDDSLFGGGGEDRINGGIGADVLVGGGSDDTFVYTGIAQSTTASRDRIADFGGADVVDLSAIDANTNVGGNQAFAFIGSLGFSGAGQLRFVDNGVNGFVLGDTDGDGVADLNIQLDGILTMNASDFIL